MKTPPIESEEEELRALHALFFGDTPFEVHGYVPPQKTEALRKDKVDRKHLKVIED